MKGSRERGILRAVGLGANEERQRLSLQVRGEADIAELIVSLAIKHSVPVIERRGIYALFSDIQIDEVIPPGYYAIIEGLRSEIQKDLG
jgi:type III secretion system FlhB-like substrate exporter